PHRPRDPPPARLRPRRARGARRDVRSPGHAARAVACRAGQCLRMAFSDVWLFVSATLLVLLAGLFSAADAALGGFSHARAEELRDERRPGARQLVELLEDSSRSLNTALLLRLACETAAIVLVALWVHDQFDGNFWPTFLTAAGAMLVVSFVVIGVAPRTLGRQ